jgi:hypothetical protein
MPFSLLGSVEGQGGCFHLCADSRAFTCQAPSVLQRRATEVFLRCRPREIVQRKARSACNPSYSGGRYQEDHYSKPAQANSSWDSISKKPFTKKGWWSGSRCKPWVQTPVPQKKKNRQGRPRTGRGSILSSRSESGDLGELCSDIHWDGPF